MTALILRAKLNHQKRTYRDIAITPSTTLYKLANYVIDAFDFDFDHCFGFFQSPDIYRKGKDLTHYELFYDIGEEIDDQTRSVKRTTVKELFAQPKDKWWMLFDYGDDWVFEIEYIKGSETDAQNGQVLKINGVAPSQY